MALRTWFGGPWGPPWKPVSCNRWLRLRRSQQRAASSVVDLKGQMGHAWEMKCKKGILSGFEHQLMSETPLHVRTFIEIPGFEWWFWHQAGENSEVPLPCHHCLGVNAESSMLFPWKQDLTIQYKSLQWSCFHGILYQYLISMIPWKMVQPEWSISIWFQSLQIFGLDHLDHLPTSSSHFLHGVPAPPAAASCW